MSSLRWKNIVGFRIAAQWYSPHVTPRRGPRRDRRPADPGLAGGHAVDVLDVERAEVGELDQGSDRGQARIGGPELEALDLLRLGLEGPPRELLRHLERHASRQESIATWPPPPGGT